MSETYDKTGWFYGWNGGECPVHPKTIVRVIHLDGGDYTNPADKTWGWGVDGKAPEIVAFQIVKPYSPPPATVKREVALYRFANLPVAVHDASHVVEGPDMRRISEPLTIEFTLLPGESADA